MTGGKHFRKLAALVLIAGLLGGALSGCIPYHGTTGHGSAHQHAH